MKKRFFYGALGLLTLGAFAACSSEEEQLKTQEDVMVEYQVSVGIGDMDTRSGEITPPDWEKDSLDPNLIKDCPEISMVENYITAKRLYANVGITYQPGSHPQGHVSDIFTVKLEKFT
ncbi:MAG: hypothetical protein RRZ66_08530, partial [Bacteroidales bacterium]